MIRIERIQIEEFRGIRFLELNLGGRNFAVAGPNGTGKSGIVDALEFGLTGNISRLSGKGRGALSVRDHGPHVDSRTSPEKARVIIDVDLPALGKKARITRSVKAPKVPVVTPADPDILAALKRVEEHPEFVLSRREIIKYVLAEPGERSKEVQALLQLDALEAGRANLQKIANACDRELKPLEQHRDAKSQDLTRAMGITELKQSSVLDAANAKRAVFSLPPLLKLEATTTLRDGLESLAGPAPTRVPKIEARKDLAGAKDIIAALTGPDFLSEAAVAAVALTRLKEDEAKLQGVTREGMLQTALALFDGSSCPVCETGWGEDEFRATVRSQLAHLEAIGRERREVERLVGVVAGRFDVLRGVLQTVGAYGAGLPSPVDVNALRNLYANLGDRISRIRRLLPIDEALTAIDISAGDLASASETILALERSVEALPDPTDRDAARDYLTVADERLREYQSAASKAATMRSRAKTARKVFDIYGKEIDTALDTIYQEVEGEFRAFYRAINSDDESAFSAQLTPSLGKLGFAVDFYGRGYFPPGAYHSEGHQDGMGLCLYLALMKHLLGDGFSFAVLDDVLMSVDIAHRKEVCALLKAAFPNTQFVLTTHDPVWLKHMKTAKLVADKDAIEFRKWDVDQGPSEWKTSDTWAEIDADVARNEIRAAASNLRYHLEHLAGELCDLLDGQVRYRGDHRYELGDLLPAAVGAMRGLLKEAKAAANSWNKQELVTQIAAREAEFAAVMTKAFGEGWQTNSAIHFNEWAVLQKQDFQPVVEAYKDLERQFTCSECGEYLYISYDGKTRDALRCACATTNISLRKK